MIKKQLRSFFHGHMPLRRSAWFAALILLLWHLAYFIGVGIVHGTWLDAAIVESFERPHDGRWFYYEAISFTLILPGWVFALMGLWRAAGHSIHRAGAWIVRLFVIALAFSVLVCYVMLLAGLWIFGPPAL